MKKILSGRKTGFVLMEILIAVAVVGLLAEISVSNILKARAISQANVCLNNLPPK